MNLREIESFLCVADCVSFRRAAERLHRSQSAVSVHVRHLEEEMGVPLFDRTTRRVTLTAEGRTLMIRCNIVMADLRSVAKELREESGVRRGRVSIGSSPSISTHRLPPIIAAFQERYPGVSLELHEAFAKKMYDDVLERLTDFAVGPRVRGLKDFDHQIVISDPIVAILPPTYNLSGRKSVTLREIALQAHLSMPRGTAIREVIEEAFRNEQLEFSPRFEVIHQQTLFSMVSAGLGVTILPLMSVPEDNASSYQVAKLRAPVITRDICIITLRGRKLSPPAARCADLVAHALRQQIGGRLQK